MKKLSYDFLSKCNASNCCMNELVILPPNGETGFEEYHEHKTTEIIKAKNIFSPPEQNMLMLAYPHPEAKEPFIFERFFESPIIVAKNDLFEGCFAIDISDYIGKENNEYFTKLISYMHYNQNAVYLLFMYSNNTNEINTMFEYISRYTEIRKVEIPLPTAKQLTEYTVSEIRDFSLHVPKTISDYIQEYYEKNNFGYDAADYLLRQLKNMGYKGETQILEEVFEKHEKEYGKTISNLGYGY